MQFQNVLFSINLLIGFDFLPENSNTIFLLSYNILKCEAHKEVNLYLSYKVNINRMGKEYLKTKR